MGLFSGTTLKPGDAAPDFTLSDQNGKSVSLARLRGKRVVLYFYPKADTPG
jgi:thioredoxin-dependent peroxiredoxin